MSLWLGCTVFLGAGLIYATTKIRHLKNKIERLDASLQREILYAKIYPIKRVLLRYHRLMEPHEFHDVAHQQARFRGIQGAIQSAQRLADILEAESTDVLEKTNLRDLLSYHRDFLGALSEANDLVKEQIQEIPQPSHRPPSPNDLERKMGYLRCALDEYDACLHQFNVEKSLSEMREVMETLRFYAPLVLVKPVVWEALIRNEHFLIELVNLLPEQCQKGTRTDAVMLQPAG